ncbi:MAG: CrcB family protein [Nitriliruptorales bacterium]|nr:CrcB family protein [Nitriliruptorales bacterium]
MTARVRVPLLVFVGSALGTGARALVGSLPAPTGAWPWGTFGANITGAFLLGCLLARYASRHTAVATVAFLGTGVLGSYTTFSAFSEETRALLAAGEGSLAVTYVVVSLIVGVGVAQAGIQFVRMRA